MPDQRREVRLPVKKVCAWLQVSASGFFDWRRRPASATATRRAELSEHIGRAFDASDGTYGYRRVHAQLARDGVRCGPELVRHLMADLGLVSWQPRPRFSLTERDSQQHTIPDLLHQDFTAAGLNQRWCGDIT